MSRTATRLVFVLFLVLPLLSIGASAAVTTQTGTLPDGATFIIEVPSPWNGTLLLYSHGYTFPGFPNPAKDAGDPVTRAFLLANGFALAGSSYAHSGWAVQEALLDQIAVLDTFNVSVGRPAHTIAWGHSLGGLITAGLIERFPERFDAALPMCGAVSGGIATWNQALDAGFAFKNLLAPSTPLPVVNITNPLANVLAGEELLVAAQTTPQGRARIALVAALADTPGWFLPGSPEPAAIDFNAQEENQFFWVSEAGLPFLFLARADVEFRAGGNPSWNTGVDYERQLAHSVDRLEVQYLYAVAGLDLDADLDTLNKAARIHANPASVEYLERNIVLEGEVHIPVLTMHTTGDGLVQRQNESAYKDVFRDAGRQRFLRELFVHRAGHCTFTPAETVVALENLIERMNVGVWHSLPPDLLNNEAVLLGPLNIIPPSTVLPPAFVQIDVGPFLRPFDAFDDRDCSFKQSRDHDKDRDKDHDKDRDDHDRDDHCDRD